MTVPAPDPIDVHIGHRLREMRVSHSISLETLGRRVGVSYQQVQKYESGFNRISASTLLRIARVLQLRVGWFFEGLDKAPGHDVADAETTRIAGALGRIEPVVRVEIYGLIEALARRKP